MQQDSIYSLFGKNQAGQGFYILGKECVSKLGLIRAGFISVLADFDNYAKSQGQSRFFATLETLQEKTKLSDKTIKKLMRELKDWGIIDDGVRGEGYDNKKYYTFNYESLAKIIYENYENIVDNTPNDKGKNTPYDKGKNTPYDKGKNTPNNNIRLDVQEQNNKNKSTRKSLRESLLDFAKAEFEREKPQHLQLKDFLEWINYKIDRTPKMTKLTITKNLKQLIEYGENATESIQKSILNSWQGLFMPKVEKSENLANYAILEKNKDLAESKKAIYQYFEHIQYWKENEIRGIEVFSNGDVSLRVWDRELKCTRYVDIPYSVAKDLSND